MGNVINLAFYRPHRSTNVVPLINARDLAMENLRKLYARARRGDQDAINRIRIVSGYEREIELARLARMLLDNLGESATVEAPCDVEPDGAA